MKHNTRQWMVGLASAMVLGIGAYSLHGAIAHRPDAPVSTTAPTADGQKVHLDHTVKPVPIQSHDTKTSVTRPAVITNPPGVYYSNRVVIETFHNISTTWNSQYTITPDLFSADLDKLQQAHFHVITNAQFLHFMNHTGTVPPNAVLLTFDDGYQDTYRYALPILEQHHMTGVFFTIVGTADHLAQHPPVLGQHAGYMSWAELDALEHAGNAIVSHTYDSHYNVVVNGKNIPVFDTHVMVNGVPETDAQYSTRVKKDLIRAKEELQTRYGLPVTEFAWPYGWGTPDAVKIAQGVGYRYIFTTAPGVVTATTWDDYIPRIDIGKPMITPSAAVQMTIQTGETTRAASDRNARKNLRQIQQDLPEVL